MRNAISNGRLKSADNLRTVPFFSSYLARDSETVQTSCIYQDVPLYPLDEFIQLAPPEARTEDVLGDEHQLMLNRLSFELAERQRYAFISAWCLPG